MRNLLILMVAGLVMVFAAGTLLAGQDYDQKAAVKQVRARQKEERKALKLKQKNLSQSLKNHPLPKATRVQMKHQAARERRDLRQKQKDELQQMKDRQRIVRESQKAYGPGRL